MDEGESTTSPSQTQYAVSPVQNLAETAYSGPDSGACTSQQNEQPPKSLPVQKQSLQTQELGISNHTPRESNEILDALMQHVESEAAPVPSGTTAEHNVQHPTSTPPSVKDLQGLKSLESKASIAERYGETQDNTTTEKASAEVPGPLPLLNGDANEHIQTSTETHAEPTDSEQAARQVDGIPPTETVEHVEGADGPEWEVDSSPYESSTDSDSTDTSSDDDDDSEDDEDGDNDYAMLDPEEAARILMQGDGGSDDEGDKAKGKGEGSGLKTANEQQEDIPPIPSIEITEDMRIEELGSIEAVVENNVLITGKVSGEYQVLESGSLLCLADRRIAGVVAETLGRIEQPLYTMRFGSVQDIKDKNLSEKGTVIYYVHQHSSFVFTQPLKAFKGSDASNFHDEEVGAEELEFSDDEAEKEHKRQLKMKRSGRQGDTGRGRGSGRGGRASQRGGYNPSPLSADPNGAAYENDSLEMNYDDVEEAEEGYTPLTRPTNFHQISPSAQAPGVKSNPPPFSDRGRGRGHHRGARGGRGNFRGNNNHRGGSYQQHGQNQFRNPYTNQFAQPQFPFTPPSQAPPAPSLTPQNHPPHQFLTDTSPMSPLPRQQFNFGSPNTFQQHQSPSLPQSYTQPYQQQQQQQQQWNSHVPNSFAPPMNPAAAMQFPQQYQQQYSPQDGGWHTNQAAVAEVQRQLEEMRRSQPGGNGYRGSS